MLSNANFVFLRPVVTDFLRETVAEFAAEKENQAAWQGLMRIPLGETASPFKQLLSELELSETSFAQQFLDPWKTLSPAQIEKILLHWNYAHGHRHLARLQLVPMAEYLALHWTFVNIYELKLQGLSLFLPNYAEILEHENPETQDLITTLYAAKEYSLPYRQCVRCGRLDQDERSVAFEPEGLRYCHLPSCKTSDSNPTSHDPNCCYGLWARVKDNLAERLKEDYPDQEKITRRFRKFCDKRYQENLKREWAVRPSKEKPPQWKLLFE